VLPPVPPPDPPDPPEPPEPPEPLPPPDPPELRLPLGEPLLQAIITSNRARQTHEGDFQGERMEAEIMAQLLRKVLPRGREPPPFGRPPPGPVRK